MSGGLSVWGGKCFSQRPGYAKNIILQYKCMYSCSDSKFFRLIDLFDIQLSHIPRKKPAVREAETRKSMETQSVIAMSVNTNFLINKLLQVMLSIFYVQSFFFCLLKLHSNSYSFSHILRTHFIQFQSYIVISITFSIKKHSYCKCFKQLLIDFLVTVFVCVFFFSSCFVL